MAAAVDHASNPYREGRATIDHGADARPDRRRRASAGDLARHQRRGPLRRSCPARCTRPTPASTRSSPPASSIPKSREDLVRVVNACRQHRCPITMRGGGTSQAGQAIGAGLIVDTSKYFNRILEVNVDERWARVEPGIVLDDLNAALAQTSAAVRAGYFERQPRDRRRHDRQQLGRRAVGRLRQDDRPRPGAAGAAGGRHAWRGAGTVPAAELDALSSRRRRSKPACYREVRRLAAEHAAEIERRYPKVLRRVGGYNLDEFVDRPSVQPREDVRRIRGHARHRGRGESQPRAAAGGEGPAGDSVRRSAGRARRDAGDPSRTARPPIEAMDAFILNHTKMNAELHRLQADVRRQASRQRCCASSSPAIAPRTWLRGWMPSRVTCERRDSRITCHRAIDAGGAAGRSGTCARRRSGSRCR